MTKASGVSPQSLASSLTPGVQGDPKSSGREPEVACSQPANTVASWIQEIRDNLRCDPADPCAYDNTCSNHRLLEQMRVDTIDRIVDWLHHRCDYAPPCQRCTWCAAALNIERRKDARAAQ
jgi:hypothetical protein